MRELVLAGFGGQGVLTCGLILAHIAMTQGKQVTWVPSYGSAMRGGTANCTVKYGEKTIYNPAQDAPDFLLAMNGPSYTMFADKVKPGGIILANSALVKPGTAVGKDVAVHMLDCTALAQAVGNPRGANIVMSGALIKLLGDFSKEDAIAGMNAMFNEKGKNKFEEANTKAMECGYKEV